MVKGDSKCYSEESPEYYWSQNDINLYSMRFCAFSHRVRLMLAAKKLPHNIINIDLKSMPEWFLELNEGWDGQVPTLQEPIGKVICESLIITEYLDNVHKPLYQFLPFDHATRAKQKILVEVITQKFINKLSALEKQSGDSLTLAVLDGLTDMENLLKNDFFFGPEVQWVDLMVYPWFARLPSFEALRGFKASEDRYPKVLTWLKKMQELPYVQATDYPTELMTKFLTQSTEGNPNYDEGL